MTIEHSATKKEATRKKIKISPFFIILRNIFSFLGVVILFFIIFQIPKLIGEPTKFITIQGNQIISEQIILERLNLNNSQPWAKLDPYFLTLELNRLEWIDHAVVHKTVPFGIEIQIVEKSPIAILKTKTQLFLLGENLSLLPFLTSKKSWNLPVIVYSKPGDLSIGDQLKDAAIQRTLRLMDLFKNSEALPLEAISEIHIEDPLNIKIITIPDGIQINMGHDNFETKLFYLNASLGKIKSIRNEIDYIDLRSNRGVVIKKNTQM